MKDEKQSPGNEKAEKPFSDSYLYPPGEDIYNQFKEEADLDPEDPSQKKAILPIEKTSQWNEKNFNYDVSGDDLDIPGAELDDAQEIIGSEDEENNSYSIGGDNHNDLEENKD